MYQLLIAQYEMIKGARHALFSYCENMAPADLFKKVATFNNSCIIDLLVHNANTYIGWLQNFGLDAAVPFYESGNIRNLSEVKQIFEEVDRFVADFLQKYSDNYQQKLTKIVRHRGTMATLTPLELFTHVITHEFHHKGQILTMSRALGYIPVDTDVIRT
jgi:uncharacterized damage-inducible protein DinB